SRFMPAEFRLTNILRKATRILMRPNALLGEHANVQSMTFPDQPVERTALPPREPGALAVADEDLGYAARSREIQKRIGGIGTLQDLDVCACRTGSSQPHIERRLVFRRNIRLLYIRRHEFAVELFGHDLGFFEHHLEIRARRDADQNPLMRAEVLMD